MRRGDVVLIAWPFTDMTAAKVRPAVVVSSDLFNKGPDRILVAISSKVGSSGRWDVVADDSDAEFAGTGLHHTSAFKCGKMLTLSTDLIKRRLGTAGPFYLAGIEKQVRRTLGL